ncbi:MAG: NAD-dependent epimerase/dehydratase family protein [Solirubrobacterales bacterium]
MRLLVTGSRGAVGTHLVEELLGRGHEVWHTDRGHHHEGRYVRSDIGASRQLESVFERARPELVYNLAGEFGRRNGEDFYGDYEGTKSEDVPERVPTRQLNDYAMSKWVNEMQILNAADEWGSEIVRVRLFNTYGPGEYFSEYRSAVCKFIYKAMHRKPLTTAWFCHPTC